MNSDKTYPEEMWWHHHPVFQLDELGNSSTRPGQDKAFECFWKPQERAAWTYELVRRLESMLQNNWHCESPVPPKEVLRTFAELPSYDRLSPVWQACIASTVLAAINFRFSSLPYEPVSPLSGQQDTGVVLPLAGYSPAINTSFDLTANDKTLVEGFLGIIEEWRRDLGIKKRPRNKNRPHLKVKWRSLDHAHNPVAFECPQKNASRCRKDLVETAINNLEVLGLAVVGAHCVEQRNRGLPQPIEITYTASTPWPQRLGDFPIAEWFFRHNAAVANIAG